MTTPLADRIDQLTRSRVPFVHATVVRAQAPTSAQRGRPRRSCSRTARSRASSAASARTGSVRTAALGTLETGEGVLLRVLPEAERVVPGDARRQRRGQPVPVRRRDGDLPRAAAARAAAPRRRLHADRRGGGRARAHARASWCERAERGRDAAGRRWRRWSSSHGGDEAGAIRAALDAGVGFVGLVCSRTRGEALLEELDLPEDERRRVLHPGRPRHRGPHRAGDRAVDHGGDRAQHPARGPGGRAADASLPPVEAPSAGRRPGVRHDRHRRRRTRRTCTIDGDDHWFCGPGCRDATFAGGAFRRERAGTAPRRCGARSTSTTTWPTRARRPRCSSRSSSGCRCCSRASRASARRRRPRCWPPRSTHR